MTKIFIPFNTPSSKNSQIKSTKGIFKSKTVRHYLQKLGVKSYSSSKKTYENYKTRNNVIENLKPDFLKMINGKTNPVKFGFYFIRDSKRKFDYINVIQIIADILTAHDIIKDDCADYFIPIPRGYHVDKENAGVEITVLD